MEDLSGKTLGPYQVLSPLGEGGMASVYRAFQPAVDREVALKILPRHFASNPQFIARFSQEARLVASLQHLNILPIFDFGEDDGYTYIVMPLIDSGTLADEMGKGPIQINRTGEILRQVGNALGYAHQKGIIHRDVKPSNVLIDQAGNCILTDFGIAKMVSGSVELTQTGATIGTPAYMSPEQIEGKDLDQRSDIYSLGVVLFEMLTGQVPYAADTPAAVFVKHLHDPLPLPSRIDPSISDQMELVLLKALAKDPADRFTTTKELVASFDLAHEGINDPALEDTRASIRQISDSEPVTSAEPAEEGSYPQEPPPKSSPGTITRLVMIGIPLLVLLGLLSAGIIFGPRLLNGSLISAPTSTPMASVAMSDTATPITEPTVTTTPSPVPPTATAIVIHPSRLTTIAEYRDSGIAGFAPNPEGEELAIEFRHQVNESESSLEGIMILDETTLEEIRYIPLDEAPASVSWGQGTIYVGMQDGRVLSVSPESGASRILNRFELPITDLAVSPDGDLLAVIPLLWFPRSGGREIILLDSSTGEVINEIRATASVVLDLDWDNESRRLAAATGSTIIIWDREAQTITHTMQGHDNFIWDIEWSADGKHIASASADTTLGLWDVNSRERIHNLFPANGNQHSVSLSPDGRFLAGGSSEADITIWDLESERQIISLFDEGRTTLSLYWSSNGQLISYTNAVGYSYGQRIRVWGAPD